MSVYDIKETKETECTQAVIFARVSSKKQENGVSKEAQLDAMTSYCNKQGLKIIKSYSITESSTIGDRPKFKEMIEFLKKHHAIDVSKYIMDIFSKLRTHQIVR